MARSMVPDAFEADEAAEETFLLALQSPELFPLEVPFRISLYRVAMDRSLARLRAASGRAADLLPAFDAAGRLASEEGDWSELFETLIKRRDLAARVREGLGRIDALDRASFILRDVEQLPVEEAAAILRTSPEEIRERAHRARLMLAGFFGQLFRASGPCKNAGASLGRCG